MNTKTRLNPVIIIFIVLPIMAACLAACSPGELQETNPSPIPSILPTLTLDQTFAKEFVITDFDSVHSQVSGSDNQYLVFGNLPVSEPVEDVPPELAVLLGRWEGYSYAPPVKKDRRVVFVIQELSAREGKGVGWSGTNLQYPDRNGEIHFRVAASDPPTIEFQITWPDGFKEIDTYTYDADADMLRGWARLPDSDTDYGPTELTREQTFHVYKDYARYLEGKRITSRTYQDSELAHYGNGYLLYLPEGYENDPQKTWPLLFFLHGYGDRGDNTLVLAKASPFMFIREKGPLPYIIVAPLLSSFDGYSSFPETYMEGVLAEVQNDFRIDPKRIYLTGLSMGGEAAYRFAVNKPDTFAAMAALSAYVDSETYTKLEQIKDLPIWAIHGADDTVFPLVRGQQPVDALKDAGSSVLFTILEGHDHDTWTEMYSDPAFYEWFLQYQRP